MNAINIIDHHQIIRETVGYEVLNQVPIEDMPKVMEFLKIVYNYNRMKRFTEKHTNTTTEEELFDWDKAREKYRSEIRR